MERSNPLSKLPCVQSWARMAKGPANKAACARPALQVPPKGPSALRLFLLANLAAILAALLPVLLLTGCATLSDPEAAQEPSQDAIATLNGEKIVSQTFLAHRPRLNSLTLFTRPDTQAGSGAGPSPA